MKVNKIKKLKDSRYKIEVEGEEIITYDEVILRYGLLLKSDLTSADLNDINSANNYYKYYHSCIKYIMRKLRSEKEVRQYLTSKNVDIDDIERIINELKKTNLINDRIYCRAYISDRLHLSNDGLNKIKASLLNNNISEEVVIEELSHVDTDMFNNKLKTLIVKKMKTIKGSKAKVSQKIYYDLINAGYSKEHIDECFNADGIDDSIAIKKDYERLKKQYSSKESGDKLNLKIRHKLYQKGYSMEQINKIIDGN